MLYRGLFPPGKNAARTAGANLRTAQPERAERSFYAQTRFCFADGSGTDAFCAACLRAGAWRVYYLSTPGLTVTVPDTLIAFTRSSPDSDFDAYGLDAQEVKTYMRSWQIDLSAYEVDLGHCLFDENHRYTAGLYAPLLGEAPFRRLEKWMTDHGYRAYDTYNAQWPDDQLTLCYANPAWGDERPRGGNAYKIKHTGICAQFDAYVDEPVSLGLCIPSGMKPYLAHFDQMPPKVQAFVMERAKKMRRMQVLRSDGQNGPPAPGVHPDQVPGRNILALSIFSGVSLLLEPNRRRPCRESDGAAGFYGWICR